MRNTLRPARALLVGGSVAAILAATAVGAAAGTPSAAHSPARGDTVAAAAGRSFFFGTVTATADYNSTNTGSGVRVALANDSFVHINCYTTGQNVHGDTIWYHDVLSPTGWVPGWALDTGTDPNLNVPHC